MLEVLGVTPDEDRVYRMLLTVTRVTGERVARATSLSPEQAHAVLRGLVGRGLAYETGGEYEAAPPTVAEQMLEEKVSALRSAQSAVLELQRAYRERQRTVDDVIEVVDNADEVAVWAGRIQAEATGEVLAFARLPLVTMDPADPGATATSPQVASRTVWDSEVLALPGWLETIEQYHWRRDAIRSYDNVPFKLIIVDRAVAMLPFSRSSDGSTSIAIVRGSVLLDALIALFESVWSAATPLLIGPNSSSMPTASPLGPEDGRLLSLLLAGLTDEAIAAHQGVSTRTVQRRVQSLMSAAHARTRLQLAWHAGRSGWL